MIVEGKLDKMEVEKKGGKTKSMNVGITIDDVEVKNQDIQIKYTYLVRYLDNVGQIKIEGTLTAKEDTKLAREIEKTWRKNKKNRKLPMNYSTMIINAINYTGSANGTLAARLFDLPPPLVPPQITLKKGKK